MFKLGSWTGSVVSMAVVTASLLCYSYAHSANKFEIVNDTMPMALTKRAGDPEKGKQVFADRERGHCLLCHQVSSLDEPFQGDIAPDLSNVGERLSPEQIRLRIVDPTIINPDIVMPAYYRVDGLHQVGSQYEGKPVLTAQEVEDIVAYLSSLKEKE